MTRRSNTPRKGKLSLLAINKLVSLRAKFGLNKFKFAPSRNFGLQTSRALSFVYGKIRSELGKGLEADNTGRLRIESKLVRIIRKNAQRFNLWLFLQKTYNNQIRGHHRYFSSQELVDDANKTTKTNDT